MEISSRDNKVFKDLFKLTQKKYRRQSGLCIVEGEKIVREMAETAEQVFVRKGKAFPWINAEKLIVLDDKLFSLVSELENSSGVLAVVKIPKAKEVTFPYLVLDGIQDAGNVGTVLRTAVAFGFGTVFCIDCADPWSAKVLRASSGVQFGLNIIEICADEFAPPEGSSLFGADLGGVCVSALNVKKDDKFGLVLGSEGKGIRTEIKRLVNKSITIPMNKSCESLNVAVAGGILMYELGRIK